MPALGVTATPSQDPLMYAHSVTMTPPWLTMMRSSPGAACATRSNRVRGRGVQTLRTAARHSKDSLRICVSARSRASPRNGCTPRPLDTVLYATTVWLKLSGPDWIDGTALYWVTRLPEFVRFPVPYVFDHMWTIRALTWGYARRGARTRMPRLGEEAPPLGVARRSRPSSRDRVVDGAGAHAVGDDRGVRGLP